jgi:hypothetical protein
MIEGEATASVTAPRAKISRPAFLLEIRENGSTSFVTNQMGDVMHRLYKEKKKTVSKATDSKKYFLYLTFKIRGLVREWEGDVQKMHMLDRLDKDLLLFVGMQER